MNDNKDSNTQAYKVLMNDEEQYSLWQADLDIPLGWYEQYSGTKESCLAYVREVWVDMRPKSLRDLDLPQKLISKKKLKDHETRK